MKSQQASQLLQCGDGPRLEIVAAVWPTWLQSGQAPANRDTLLWVACGGLKDKTEVDTFTIEGIVKPLNSEQACQWSLVPHASRQWARLLSHIHRSHPSPRYTELYRSLKPAFKTLCFTSLLKVMSLRKSYPELISSWKCFLLLHNISKLILEIYLVVIMI